MSNEKERTEQVMQPSETKETPKDTCCCKKDIIGVCTCPHAGGSGCCGGCCSCGNHSR